jgi:transglutaminase-like putative cysteine protease
MRIADPHRRAPATVRVGASIDIEPGTPCEAALLVHVGHRPDQLVVRDLLTVNGEALETSDDCAPIRVVTNGSAVPIVYTAEVELRETPPSGPLAFADRVRWVYPSRYCPVDRMAGYARAEFGDGGDDPISTVASFVYERIDYVGGVSDTATTAIDTLVQGAGVCRDFTHLTVALLRALSVPARYVAAYVPGLVPSDFHALVEAHDGERWRLVDPTGLSDPTYAVRIAHGRDGADVAFLTVLSGDMPIGATLVSAACV